MVVVFVKAVKFLLLMIGTVTPLATTRGVFVIFLTVFVIFLTVFDVFLTVFDCEKV